MLAESEQWQPQKQAGDQFQTFCVGMYPELSHTQRPCSSLFSFTPNQHTGCKPTLNACASSPVLCYCNSLRPGDFANNLH